MPWKSMDWFLYDANLRHERVKWINMTFSAFVENLEKINTSYRCLHYLTLRMFLVVQKGWKKRRVTFHILKVFKTYI